jgi:uncharacterized protein (TIGR02118 family)
MFKVIILLTRRDDMTREAFADWWLQQHAPMARRLPGLKRLTFNLVTTGTGIDGVSELWFDTQADFEAAYATEVGRAVVADSTANVAKRERLFVAEHAQL